MIKSIALFLQQAACCMRMPRSHIKSLGNTHDSVASHSFHVSIIAYSLARMEGLSHSEGLQALAMGVFHDLAEARTGDADFVAKNYIKIDEPKAVTDQFSGLPFANDLCAIVIEYEQRETLASKCAKDADSLAQVFHEWYLMWQGNAMAKQWFEGDFEYRLPALRTESAKQIMRELPNTNPNEWWWTEFVERSFNNEHLNSH